MSKLKTVYVCQNCTATFPKWMGRCTQCHSWNTIEEEVIEQRSHGKTLSGHDNTREPVTLSSVKQESHKRLTTKISELDRVLGGGLMPGSVILIGGEPGIGKSTLLLQLALNNKEWKTLYVAGEESEAQIKDRADRLGETHKNIYITTQLVVEELSNLFQTIKPDIVIVDSIQTTHSSNLESIPGTISQIRESAYQLINTAKTLNIPLILVGHITKIGNIAGPKVLEHLVDTVLQFEGDTNSGLRILRTTKNRFGNTAEIGIFEMLNNGLNEISNPTEILVNLHTTPLPGIALALINEGIRPLVIEVQALVSTANFGTPQRSSTGYDPKRLNMLLAVLEKRAGLKLSTRDVFINVTGGIKITDTAADLAIAASIVSSYFDLTINPDTCFAGEIGLSGEIRTIRTISQRIDEALRLGFKEIITANHKKNTNSKNIIVDEIRTLVKILNNNRPQSRQNQHN